MIISPNQNQPRVLNVSLRQITKIRIVFQFIFLDYKKNSKTRKNSRIKQIFLMKF